MLKDMNRISVIGGPGTGKSTLANNIGKEKPEIPGCKEQMNWKFLKLVIKWEQGRKQLINETLEKNKDKNIIIFKNRRKLNKWYNEEFGKRIEV